MPRADRPRANFAGVLSRRGKPEGMIGIGDGESYGKKTPPA